MENISYIGLSQQMALRRLMDMTANNMANMSTPGYKAQNVMFGEYLNKAVGTKDEKVSQVQEGATYRDLSQGTMTQTSNQLDFAIEGKGYFTVQTPDGPRYTRAGSFSLNNARELVTKTGYRVLSEVGSPITIQPGAMHVTVNASGSISTEKGNIAKFKVVTFGYEQMMTPVGDNLYAVENVREQPVDKPHVEQGMLEGSNVQPILEMNKMIEILRMYQAAQNMVLADHDRIRSMIQQLTRT